MSRYINFAEEEYYHIYNRGTEKRLIFSNNKDRDRFIALLYLCNSQKTIHLSDHKGLSLQELLEIGRGDPLVYIGAYCLMPNHFHLLIKEAADNGISTFMQKVMTAYTMYFNKKNERSGALFQGKFKARHLDNDEYLKYIFSYIHLNPIKLIDPDWKEKGVRSLKSAREYLESYKYSSYLDYLDDERSETVISNKEAFPEYFSNTKDFLTEIGGWLTNVKVEP